MDPNQFNLKSNFNYPQNSNSPPHSNFQNPPNAIPQNQNPNFQYYFFPQNPNHQPFPFPHAYNQPINTMGTPYYQFESQFGISGSRSASIGGSADASPQTPVNLTSSTPPSQFLNHEGLESINLNHEEEAGDEQDSNLWCWEEDKLLISAWLNVSKDPIVGTDQKGANLWKRIHEYCEQSNPGLIKRGVVAMKKRWHRISMGVQKFGASYDEALRNLKSGCNNDDLMQMAMEIYKVKAKVSKCLFVQHWHELRREQKWKSQVNQCGGSKRTKVSASGAYSSSTNTETTLGEDVEVQGSNRPQGAKAAKRKGKEKAKKTDYEIALLEQMKNIKEENKGKLEAMEHWNRIKEEEIKKKEEELKIQERKIKEKERKSDMKIIYADMSKMNDDQKRLHLILLEEIKDKYNM